MTVFLCTWSAENPLCTTPATQEQRAAILARLRVMPGVAKVVYESPQEALARFKRAFADQPEVARDVQVGDIPDSFKLRLTNTADVSTIKFLVSGLRGVDQVITRSQPS